ncbi:peptidyl-prolyl cis-trans isomerase [Ottowia testudinis]|uniref:Peptidyl-prolyl cis-trans isomerase n=2 Tax=Ottowia testudinis TaxID=2816950 RepID=A0A975CM01_9BURK|nr:peptidyl-prolyl cis-trans isomerase [Ottowia testudinis]
MAVNRALVLEGLRLKEPRAADRAADRFDDVYGNAIYQKLARSCERPVDGAAARRYFDQHADAFKVPPSARLTRIMLPISAKIDDQLAMDWLLTQAQAVSSGKASLHAVVSRVDAVYRLEPQGDIGWATLEGDNLVIRALADAKEGELLGPVREGDFGYLYKVVSKREGRQLTWEEAALSAPSRALAHCRQQANQELSKELFAKYGIQLDEKAIQGLFSSSNDQKK